MALASRRLLANLARNVGRIVLDARQDGVSVAQEAVGLGVSTSQAWGELRAAARGAPRVAVIAAEVSRIAASYGFAKAKLAWLEAVPTDAFTERLHRLNAERLLRLCTELRGAVLKVGQLLSSRADLLPPAYIERLSELQDRVPPVPTEAIVARIEAELGQPVGELFAELEEVPLAAASLAQVHGARLRDGTPVVVKVQLPGIEERVEADLAAFQLLARVLRDRLPEVDWVTVADELGRSIRVELDYVAEAATLARVAQAFAGDGGVVVPRVFEALSSGRVLTLERLDGARLTDFLDGCEARGDEGAGARDRVLELLVHATARQILEHGVFQGDPHPGNFLVLDGPDGVRLGLLDFGNVGLLPGAARRGYVQLVMAILGGNVAAFASGLSAMGFSTPCGREAALDAFAERFIQLFRADLAADLGQLDARDLMTRGLGLARAHPIHIPEDFVLLGRVFATLGGILMRYGANLNLPRVLAPHLASALA